MKPLLVCAQDIFMRNYRDFMRPQKVKTIKIINFTLFRRFLSVGLSQN